LSRLGLLGRNSCKRLQRSSPRASFWWCLCTRQPGRRPKSIRSFNSYSGVVEPSSACMRSRRSAFRYRQAEIAGIAAVDRLERTAGLASAVLWLRKAHVTERFGVDKRARKLRSFFSRWSIKFSAEYYEAKERQASGVLSNDTPTRGSNVRSSR